MRTLRASGFPPPDEITLLYCILTIRKLKRLQDLIRHQNRWAHQMDLARPLRKLGIAEKDPHRSERIRAAINRLLPTAKEAATSAGVSAGLIVSEQRRGTYPEEYADVTYSIFDDFEQLLSKDGPSARYFDMVLDVLERTIGYYSHKRAAILLGLLNPVRLLGRVLGLPLKVLEYAGVKSHGSTGELILNYVLKALTAIALALLSIRWGAKSELIQRALEYLK